MNMLLRILSLWSDFTLFSILMIRIRRRWSRSHVYMHVICILIYFIKCSSISVLLSPRYLHRATYCSFAGQWPSAFPSSFICMYMDTLLEYWFSRSSRYLVGSFAFVKCHIFSPSPIGSASVHFPVFVIFFLLLLIIIFRFL